MGPIIIDIDPILLQVGPLAVRWYGLMYAVGIAVGLWVILPFARQRGISDDDLWDAVWPAVIAGMVGARLYFVVQQPLDQYIAEPWRIVATWEGGMAFYGAVFGVAIALWWVARAKGISLWDMLDVGAIFAIIGQAFGRVGNIINGDIVGAPTDLPWGFVYVHPNSFVPDHTIAYQPAAVYELIFNLTFFAILFPLRNKMPRPGVLFAVYLIIYSLGQFLLFFLRTEPMVAFGLKQAQLTAVVVFFAGILLALWLMRQPRRVPSAS